jgi:hypothetical protein
MKVIAFQAKAALLSKEGDTSFFRMFFGLEKPNFHNRRIYSAA